MREAPIAVERGVGERERERGEGLGARGGDRREVECGTVGEDGV